MFANTKRTAAALLSGLLLLAGCSDNSSQSSGVEQRSFDEGIITVSGRVIDKGTRAALNDVTVRLKVNGIWQTDLSGPSDNDLKTTGVAVNNGDFFFANLPEGSDFFIEISDPEAHYAAKYYMGKTQSRSIDTVDGSITQDLGTFELVGQSDVSITLKNARDNSPLTGLTLYYNPVELLAGGNDTLLSNSISDVIATESNGVYTFKVPDDGAVRDVYVNSTTVGGVRYVPYDGSVITDNLLTQVSTGSNQTIFLVPETQAEFHLTLHLVDEAGHDTEIPNAVIPVANNQTAATHYAYKSATVANRYELTLTASDAAGASFSLTLPNLDTNDDGFLDTQAQHITVNPLSFDAGSFDGESRTLTQVVELLPILYNQDITATVLSDPRDFQAGVEAKLIIGFDRPVQLVHTPTVSLSTIEQSAPKISLNSPAGVYDSTALDAFGTPTGALLGNIAVNTTAGTEGTYSYATGAATSANTSQMGDANNQLASPFETLYSTQLWTISDVTTNFRANNTILELSLDPATVLPDHQYTFLVSVEGTLTDAPRLVLQQTIAAVSSDTLVSLSQLSIDDGNFKDTGTRNLADATQESYLSGATPHAAKLFTTLANYWDGTNNLTAYLNYVDYQNTGAAAANPASLPAGLYLVSPVKLEGSAQIVSYVETYQDAGVTTTATVHPSNMQYIFGLDYQSDSTVGLGANVDNGGELSATNNIASTKLYALTKPANQILDGKANLQTVYGVASEVAGLAVAEEGVCYVYQLPAIPPGNGGYVSRVTLDMKVKGGNGVIVSGEQTFDVK